MLFLHVFALVSDGSVHATRPIPPLSLFFFFLSLSFFCFVLFSFGIWSALKIESRVKIPDFCLCALFYVAVCLVMSMEGYVQRYEKARTTRQCMAAIGLQYKCARKKKKKKKKKHKSFWFWLCSSLLLLADPTQNFMIIL
ncbi:hypothetical protein BC940DRAFT_105910 [Gongronella butleri]|nr:hypothetical protein BC940DRAFT_105910 [Gongronella butleri]